MLILITLQATGMDSRLFDADGAELLSGSAVDVFDKAYMIIVVQNQLVMLIQLLFLVKLICMLRTHLQ